ncbi:MAG: hypothetical protein E7471_00625 [Ruminococcaceae bacterium]|nr:hypothetical protein [Oscillospiraceae bacterium]
MKQNLILVSPDEAHLTHEKKAYLAYRILGDHLFRGAISSDTHGGWMVIVSIESNTFSSDLFSEIISECLTFGYDGVLFLSASFSQESIDFLSELKNRLFRYNISLILPLTISSCCHGAKFHFHSAVSGGSLRGYLEDLIRKFGAKNLVVEHQLTRRKFDMPSSDASGTPITECELQKLLSDPGIQPFYSPELCMNYCTYHTKDGAQFVLFDDARSLSAKANLCETLGIEQHLYLFSEVKNLYSSLCF